MICQNQSCKCTIVSLIGFYFYRYLGNLICVEGIVTRVSLVRPKVVRSVHYCPATKKVMERKYTDLTSFEAFPTSALYPTKVTFRFKSIFQSQLQAGL